MDGVVFMGKVGFMVWAEQTADEQEEEVLVLESIQAHVLKLENEGGGGGGGSVRL